MTAQVLQACDELLETLAALCRAHPTTSGASAPAALVVLAIALAAMLLLLARGFGLV